MNGITYFRLVSPYEGDITKNCALTGSEVDNNFFTLEGRDIKSVELVNDKIVVNLVNGKTITTDPLTENCVKDLEISFDEVNGILTIIKDGVTQTITGFATSYNTGEAISVDGTLVGNGLAKSPVGISPVTKTGQYRPVKRIVRYTDGEKLPKKPNLFPGDRYLTVENVNDYGYLYNYEGLKKIACQLREANSPWRIPTKADWDDMLNAVEPNEDFRNHNDARTNKFLGRFAGKFLKSKDYWKKETESEGCNCGTDTPIDYSESSCGTDCSCGHDTPCHPSYCGEYGSCHHRCHDDNSGLDKYGFKVVPAGYANEAKDFLYFKERAYFWTASNHEYRDAYIKAFAYNKSSVLQDVMASDNYMSVRLVKDFTGDNFNEREDILGSAYSTVLMPSITHGSAIWTSINISIGDCDCGCKHILPNDGQGLTYSKKYFVNEWNGKTWMRKEVAEGESVVVFKDGEKDYAEYRVVNGELVDVASMVYDDVMENITPIVTNLETEIQTLDAKIDAEIERSTTKDNEIETSVNSITERLTEDEAKIDKNIQDIEDLSANITEIGTTLEALDTELEEEKQIREQADNAINENISSLQETVDTLSETVGTVDGQTIVDGSYDKDNGTLTLNRKNGENNITVQFNFNFGTF